MTQSTSQITQLLSNLVGTLGKINQRGRAGGRKRERWAVLSQKEGSEVRGVSSTLLPNDRTVTTLPYHFTVETWPSWFSLTQEMWLLNLSHLKTTTLHSHEHTHTHIYTQSERKAEKNREKFIFVMVSTSLLFGMVCYHRSTDEKAKTVYTCFTVKPSYHWLALNNPLRHCDVANVKGCD